MGMAASHLIRQDGMHQTLHHRQNHLTQGQVVACRQAPKLRHLHIFSTGMWMQSLTQHLQLAASTKPYPNQVFRLIRTTK